MPSDMIACPNCGESNSAKKRVCHHCHGELGTGGSVRNNRTVAKAKTARNRLKRLDPPAPAQKQPFNLGDIVFGVSLRQRAQFYRQMYSLLQAGIPVGLSLSHSEKSISYQMRGRIRQLAEHTQSGKTLSEGMSQFPALFTAWEVSVVQAAEKAGTLPQVMRDIASTLEMEYDLRARTKASTFHLQITAWAAIFVVLLVFSLRNVTGGLSGVLTALTAVSTKFFLIILLLIVLINAWRAFGRTRIGGRIVSWVMPRVPLVGPILQGLARIRFLNILSAMWHAGVAPIESLEIAARTTGNYNLMYKINDMSGRIAEGASLAAVLGATKFLPEQAMYLVQTGEMTGDMSAALDKVAEYYTVEVEALSKTLPVKVQVIMYIIIVPVVIWLMVTVYGGYFEAILKIGE